MSKKATFIGGLVLLTLFGLTTTSFALSNDMLHVGSEAGSWYGQWQFDVNNSSKTNTNISATGNDLRLQVGSEAGSWYGQWQYDANDSETNTNISATGDDLRLHVGSEAGNWYGKWQLGGAESNKLGPQEQTVERSDMKCPMLTC